MTDKTIKSKSAERSADDRSDCAEVEEWRQIARAGYLSRYEASSLGNLRHARTKRLKSSAPNAEGRVPAVLQDGPRMRCHYRSRLVCLAFNGKPPTRKHQAAHRDGDKLNDRPGNLWWRTGRQNMADGKPRHELGGPQHRSVARAVATLDRELAELPSGLLAVGVGVAASYPDARAIRDAMRVMHDDSDRPAWRRAIPERVFAYVGGAK